MKIAAVAIIAVLAIFGMTVVHAESDQPLNFRDPVHPYYIEEGEQVFSLDRKTTFVTENKRGKTVRGWLPKGEQVVGRLDSGKKHWRAVRIYKCGNPILEPRNLILGANYRPVDDCGTLQPSDVFLWAAGPGLIAYGIGDDDARWATTSGQVLSGLAVLNLARKSERQWCQLRRKFIIGTVTSAIGYLVGKNQQEKRERYRESVPVRGDDGPGLPPPNAIAVNLHF